jgi:hypothetical protein
MRPVNLIKALSFLIILAALTHHEVYALDRGELLRRVLERKANPGLFYPGINEDPRKLRHLLGRLERLETRIRAQKERRWWKGRPILATQADLERAIAEGRVSPMRDLPGLGMSTNNKMPYTTPVLELAQQDILSAFNENLIRRGINPDKKLVITSIIRTKEYQIGLIAEKYPAATRSSHTLGVAFDISTQWFEEKAPEYARVLHGTLFQNFRKAGKANVIREELQKVWHIGISPAYHDELLMRLPHYPGWIQ